jgi:hypothetical protein
MLKMSRIRLCEYNKSCCIFHIESNKIGLAFFWIFYDFICILQVSANGVYYWRCNFVPRPSKRFRTTQLGPSTHGTAGSPEIRRLRRRSRLGKGSGSSACSPRVGWRSWFGRRSHRRGRSAVAGGGGRGSSGFQRGGHLAGQCAALGGAMGPREESGTVGRRQERAERRAHRRRRQWQAAAWWCAEGKWRHLNRGWLGRRWRRCDSRP